MENITWHRMWSKILENHILEKLETKAEIWFIERQKKSIFVFLFFTWCRLRTHTSWSFLFRSEMAVFIMARYLDKLLKKVSKELLSPHWVRTFDVVLAYPDSSFIYKAWVDTYYVLKQFPMPPLAGIVFPCPHYHEVNSLPNKYA